MGIDQRKLTSRLDQLENGYRLESHALRLGHATRTPEQVGEQAEHRRLAVAVAEFPAARQRALERIDGLLDLVREVALVPRPLEQRCELRRGQIPRVAQRAQILRGRLAMRSLRRRTRAGGRRVLQGRRRVAGGLRVMCQLRRVGCALGRLAQGLEHPPVQQNATARAHGLLDGESSQLVAERHRATLAVQHACLQARIEVHDLIRHDLVEQPQLRRGGHHRDCLQHASRGRAETGHAAEHGVSHGRRYLRPPSGQHLRHEERIAGRPHVELVGVDPVRLGELRDGCAGERWKTHAHDALGGAELTDDETQWVRRVKLVLAIRDDDQGAQRLGAPGEQAQDVEGRLVRAVDILEDRDRRAPRLQFLRKRDEDRVRFLALVNRGQECSLCGRGDVDQRAQGPGRLEGVALAPEHARSGAVLIAELAYECALADARLAGDEHQPPAPGSDANETLGQRCRERRALEQCCLGDRQRAPHGGIVRRGTSEIKRRST